jgi:hypothetical protein
MIIQLTEVNADFVPPRTGKYLVRTKTELGYQFVQAHVELLPKDSKHKYSIDVHNQIPTHISTEPIL